MILSKGGVRLDKDLREKIELEVLRKISETEGDRDKKILEEISSYREFLQKQFRNITWSLSIILVASVTLFTFFFGKNLDEAKEQLIATIDTKIVDYRITESFQKRLEELVNISVNGERVAEMIEGKVDAKAAKVSSEIINEEVRKTLDANVKNVLNSDLEKLINIALQSQMNEFVKIEDIRLLKDEIKHVEMRLLADNYRLMDEFIKIEPAAGR